MATSDEQDPPGPHPSGSRPSGLAALDSEAPRVTLPSSAEEEGGSAASPGPANREAPSPLDAWNQDRIRRSSFPPAGTNAWVRRLAQSPTGELGGSPPDDGHAEEGDALALVHRSSTSHTPVDLAAEMEERFALDDFSGALRAAEFLLGRDPADPRALHYAEASRRKLEQILYSRLTQKGTVPIVAVREAETRWLGLDSRAAFLLSRVDGSADCDTLLEACGVGRLEGLRLFTQLLEIGAIRMR